MQRNSRPVRFLAVLPGTSVAWPTAAETARAALAGSSGGLGLVVRKRVRCFANHRS